MVCQGVLAPAWPIVGAGERKEPFPPAVCRKECHLRRDFLRQPVQPIVGPSDRCGHVIARIFFLHLRDPVARIIRVVGGRAVVEGGFRPAVQRVVRIRRHLALPIRDGGDIAVVVIGVRLGVDQRIFARGRAIHVGIGVDGLLGFRVGHGQQIAVGVVGEPRRAADRIRQLGDEVEGIRGIERLLPVGIGDDSESTGGIQNPLGGAIQWGL
jgi:hypothetical protein